MATRKTPARKADDKTQDTLTRFLSLLARAEKQHEKRIPKFKRRHDAYLGIMLPEDKRRWPRPVAPKWGLHSLEVLVSNLADEHVKAVVRPVERTDVEKAEKWMRVLGVQRARDAYSAKQQRWVRETAVMGIGPCKRHWHTETLKDCESVRWVKNAAGGYERISETYDHVVHDEPSLDPIDVYDFMPDPSASRTDEMDFAFCRYWVPLDTLKRMIRRDNDDGTTTGVYDADAVARLAETRGPHAKDKKLTGRDHGDCIEVIELHTKTRLVVVGNRTEVLQDADRKWLKGRLPLIVAHTVPDLYTMDGLSVAEVIEPLQTAAWEVLNDLLKAVRLASQLMVKRQVDAKIDGDNLEAETGNVIDVEAMDDLEFWTAGGAVLEPALSTLEMLKTAIQETSGANAYLAGGASETIDQKTATGISIIQSMAQKMVLNWKQSIAIEREFDGQMEIDLNQQFMTRAEEVRIDPGDATALTEKVFPWELDGRFDYKVEEVDENLNKQTARQESALLFDRLAPLAMQAQPGMVKPRMEKVLESFLKSWDVEDVEAWLETVPLPMLPPGLPAGPGGAPLVPGTPMPAAGAGAGAGGVGLSVVPA